MEDRFLEILAAQELLQVEKVAMVANAEERLVKRRQPLLAVEHEKCVLGAVELGRTFEFAHRKHALGIAHAQDASGRVVVGDRNNQFLRRARLPDEVTLEVGKHGAAIVDLGQEFLERPWVGIFKQVHVDGFY